VSSPKTPPPNEVVVHNEPDACAYIDGREARLPLRLPLRRLSPEETDERWAQGDRRHGFLLYRPQCQGCQACEPIRLPVDSFRPSKTQRRVKKRGDALLETRVGKPRFTHERLALYERHKDVRGLRIAGESAMGPRGYKGFFVDECVEALELSYWLGDTLAGVAIADRGAASLSAVYAFYDPDLANLSLGTYSILKQLELCATWGLRHLYLGYYVAENAHMLYKARFKPHERLIGGRWTPFE